MKHGRYYRITIGVLLPPLLGFIPVGMYLAIDKALESSSIDMFSVFIVAGGILMVLIGSYLFVGVQSIVYSLVMEFLVAPKVRSKKLAIFLSGAMGFLSGLLISTGLSFLGLLVGCLVGWYLISHYQKSVNKGLHRNHSLRSLLR